MALWKKILCGALVALLVIIGVIAIVFRDEICAVFFGLQYSSEELEQKLEENEQAINDAAQVVPDFTVRDLTEEEKQGLKDGTITKEELIESLIQPVAPGGQTEDAPASSSTPAEQTKPGTGGQASTQQPTQSGTGGATQPQTNPGGQTQVPTQPATGQPQVGDYQKQLAALIAEVYVLRGEFLIALDNLLAQAKAEYLSIPAAERKSKLASLAGPYFSKAYSLESECDARMKNIIGRMETLLKENGGDLSIAQTVYDTYLNEKSLKKSWYLAELRKRGI